MLCPSFSINWVNSVRYRTKTVGMRGTYPKDLRKDDSPESLYVELLKYGILPLPVNREFLDRVLRQAMAHRVAASHVFTYPNPNPVDGVYWGGSSWIM